MTLEGAGDLLSRHRYWIIEALIDAKFHWHQQYDKAGEERSPYDAPLDQIPREADKIADPKGYYRQAEFRHRGFVPNVPVYHWLGIGAEQL